MDKHDKPIRSAVYIVTEARERRLERLAALMGAGSASDAVRRLIDQACEQAGIVEPGEQTAFRFDLPRPGATGW